MPQDCRHFKIWLSIPSAARSSVSMGEGCGYPDHPAAEEAGRNCGHPLLPIIRYGSRNFHRRHHCRADNDRTYATEIETLYENLVTQVFDKRTLGNRFVNPPAFTKEK